MNTPELIREIKKSYHLTDFEMEKNFPYLFARLASERAFQDKRKFKLIWFKIGFF